MKRDQSARGASERDKLALAELVPCEGCPFRSANHGKRIPKGVYSKANAQRLWTGVSKGERVVCFEADTLSGPPEECSGSLILVTRHLHTLRKHGLSVYQSLTPSPLSQKGARLWRSRQPATTLDSFQDVKVTSASHYAVPWPCPVTNT